MSHQDGLGDNGPETTGLSKPDDGDDRMEKKSENVAHARDGIKLKNLKNSGRLRNSPTTGLAYSFTLRVIMLPALITPRDVLEESIFNDATNFGEAQQAKPISSKAACAVKRFSLKAERAPWGPPIFEINLR